MDQELNEFLIGAGVVILLVLLLNPLGFYMPSMMVMVVVSAIAVLVFLWLSLIWGEQVRDERESWHRLRASRAAFLVGTVTLLVATIWQSWTGRLDPWVIVALGLMVLAKLAAQRNNRAKN
jgi:peptidoglycan/LPS O-acetylase OafA/YrhL